MTTKRRRFWTRARVVAAADGFGVCLDARPVRLPDGAVLRCARLALAEALAEEWDLAGAEGGMVGADELILTGLAGTMQRLDEAARAALLEGVLGFADGELLCYRARQPEALVAWQAAQWQPWLEWLRAESGIALQVGEGVMPMRQPRPAREFLRGMLEQRSKPELIGLGVVVPALGSLVLGLALCLRRLDPAEAARLARLDEIFQASQWGVDAQAQARAARLEREVVQAARFMALADG